MKSTRSHSIPRHPQTGFTLIELLVVMAILSILLAMTLPVLHRARTLARRIACGSRLKDIAVGWHMYLGDNNQQFYQAFNANHDFGGWKGIAGGAAHRPLNKYLPTDPNGPGGTGSFRCPADQGDTDCGPVAYFYFGNSYQTNLMLIGPDSLPTGLPEPMRGLNRRINAHLKNLKRDAVCDPVRLLLAGDNNWTTQWDPLIPDPGRSWHGVRDRFNMAFLDGHVAHTEIHKGVYIDNDYRIQPFRDLDCLTRDTQDRIVDEVRNNK